MPADIFRRFGENDENENMVSNLPLLFAGGYPTSLDKINESQLEKFIPFMVQCSLGDIQSPVLDSSCEPEWWPEDVSFTIPLRKPANFTDDWLTKLKEIVAICYQFHKSVFLLRFCENLSAYTPESLRFINNYNSTTSLFDRVSNKLLVTFRNENMQYDNTRINNKKTLMPRMQNSQSGEPQQMVEQSLFDIYLCDNCEAELYSLDAYQEHEKICASDNMASESDDDDVIFCGEEEPSTPEDKSTQQNSFLQHFQLCSNIPLDEKKPLIKALSPHKRTSQTASSLGSNNNNSIFSNKNSCVSVGLDMDAMTDKKVKPRVPRRAPGVMALLKSQIPITSPAGQRLIAQSNTPITDDYIRERVERYERFCAAPPLAPDGSNRPKFLDKKPMTYNISTFRSNTKHFHSYKFPRRQLSTKARNEAVAQLERIQLQQTRCKPLHITVQRLSHKEIENLKTQQKVKRRKISFKPEDVIDIIDLCSDAESTTDSIDETIEASETSSSSTRVGRRMHYIQPPAHNTLLFVDCSVPNDSFAHSGVENIIDPRLQLNTTRSPYDSAANLLDRKPILRTKLYTATHRSVDFQQIQQDKENRIFSYLSNQSNNPGSAAFIYAEDDLNMNIDSSIVPASLSSSNLISIDLTL
ncbi:uncharacterized protein LOC129565136 isoform X2 [Sitodiplosis mosellana]|nr:uncharacterized protein LOC129565136 isoform X2 [Sitodiplosis mosellana]XP_055295618.1 uncharacterized protein LOC129565136 isoform X2 [Sitodiplosis mosellana]